MHRKLGRHGLNDSPIGLGLAGLSRCYGPGPANEERFELLDRALELGATFWDTSDFYGDNEDMLAQWFRRTGKRDQIFLATKGGLAFDRQAGRHTAQSSAENIHRACEASLKRLGVRDIDLYYAHRLNPETPVEDTMRAMVELQKQGKIKNIGLSGVSAATLRRAYKIAPVAAIQMEYSPFVLDIEGSSQILSTCRELGVAVVCYSPLGRGMLTNAFINGELVTTGPDNVRSFYPRFKAENIPANVRAVESFKHFADSKKCTPSQLALAWLLAQGNDIIPIPGTKKVRQLEENMAASAVELSPREESQIRKYLEHAEIAGNCVMAESRAFDAGDTIQEGDLAA